MKDPKERVCLVLPGRRREEEKSKCHGFSPSSISCTPHMLVPNRMEAHHSNSRSEQTG